MRQIVTERIGRIWREALSRPQPRVPYAAWVRGVCKNVLREIRAAHALQRLDTPDLLSGTCEAPDVLAARAEDLQLLHDACADVPSDWRAVLRLRLMGLRWKEVVEIVRGWEAGVSESTLKRYFRRAGRILRDRLRGANPRNVPRPM